MARLQFIVVIACSLTVAALLLLASGCATPKVDSMADNVDAAPLLVQFTAGCPVDVSSAVESCASLPPNVRPGKDLVCRNKGKKIVWLAVTGTSPPYHPEPAQQFTLDGVPARNPNNDRCAQSTEGVLDCKIDPDAHGEYKYAVHAGACPVLDPRIYVP